MLQEWKKRRTRAIEALNSREIEHPDIEIERPIAEIVLPSGNPSQGEGPASQRKGNIGSGRSGSEIESVVETKSQGDMPSMAGNIGSGTRHCPYCGSNNFVKRGTRQKKKEKVQLYLCSECRRTFTPFSVKGKRYSLPVIIDAISYYNLGFSFEQVSRILKEKQGVEIQPSSIANWYNEFKGLCAYHRMRQFAVKEFSPKKVIESATLAHRQLYRYRFHRAKAKYTIGESFRHYRFAPLKEFLEMVPGECPHQYFQEGLRASESPLLFNKKEMIVRSKENYATKLAGFVLQAAKTNQERHELLQKFMLANDSVTIATEVPVYLTREDLAHMQKQLNFKMYLKTKKGEEMREAKEEDLPRLITGHIDFIQIRNGMIHILDYKPQAEKERPIEQLTLYALALSRLTGLRVFHFKCAWFDEKNYFEFYPLHAVYKKKGGRKRKNIKTLEGVYKINEEADKIKIIRPIIRV